MKWLKRIAKILLYSILVIILVCIGFGIYVYNVSDIQVPKISTSFYDSIESIHTDSNHAQIGENWIRRKQDGMYEMYIEGDGFERGVLFGKLAKQLVRDQELAFTNEIQRMIPSKKYLKFLKYVVGFMNRDLPEHVIPEYQHEIYGVSLSASQEFNWIGTNYTRQLNYHAAHDIGHALANMMLVGCTSFATWGARSADSQLVIGRNFDFYVGDEFAKNKIIAFYKPRNGIPFMSVTWGGFIGVVSGMNMSGLTVTINANKSSIPYGAATPVSLVAREILQYASTIDEAIAIAKKRKMFVSESFLIGSAKDHRAVVIEKTPDELDIYTTTNNEVLCANHYQGPQLAHQKLNEEQMQQSASVYRYKRLQQLLNRVEKNTPQQTATILRDYKGLNDADIGLTNEKALNQFIAHHSIIFQPEKRLVWVSTSPWQLGTYLCYDLSKIFLSSSNDQIASDKFNIGPDTILNTSIYSRLQQYLLLEQRHLHHLEVDPNSIVACNPTYYDSYRIAGDILVDQHQVSKAVQMYQKALTLEIATQGERASIQEKLNRLQKP